MKIKNLNKEIKDIKKDQMKILELKSTVTDINHSLDWLSGKLEIREERICEFEDTDPI